MQPTISRKNFKAYAEFLNDVSQVIEKYDVELPIPTFASEDITGNPFYGRALLAVNPEAVTAKQSASKKYGPGTVIKMPDGEITLANLKMRVVSACMQAGISMRVLSQHLGYKSDAHVSLVLNGHARVTEDMIQDLSEFFSDVENDTFGQV